MSFGFSVGDFLAILTLAGKIRKDFKGAPSQFKSISDDVRSLSIVIQDAHVNIDQMSDDQTDNFNQILTTCKDLLTEKKHQVGLVAEELLKKEMLGREDMIRLLGPRPFEDPQDFHKYFGGEHGKVPGLIEPSGDQRQQHRQMV